MLALSGTKLRSQNRSDHGGCKRLATIALQKSLFFCCFAGHKKSQALAIFGLTLNRRKLAATMGASCRSRAIRVLVAIIVISRSSLALFFCFFSFVRWRKSHARCRRMESIEKIFRLCLTDSLLMGGFRN